MKCVCCGSKIPPLLDEDKAKEFDIIFDNKSDKIMWNDGTVGSISSGYGSRHDGGMLVIGICDDCLDIKTEDGSIALIGDYMMQKHTNEEPDIFTNRKQWLRNKNLDELC